MVRDPEFYAAAERRIERLTLLIGLLAAAVAGYRYGWRFGCGLLGGVVIGWLNFRWLKQGVGTALDTVVKQMASAGAAGTAGDSTPEGASEAKTAPPVKMPKRVYARLLARYGLLLLVVYVMLTTHFVPGVAVLAGLFAIVAATIGEMLYEVLFLREN